VPMAPPYAVPNASAGAPTYQPSITPGVGPAPDATAAPVTENGVYFEKTPKPEVLSALQNGQANTGKLGVDLAVTLDEMRNNSRVGENKCRNALGRNCVEINGVWVDDG